MLPRDQIAQLLEEQSQRQQYTVFRRVPVAA
jgi:hypothetical protein